MVYLCKINYILQYLNIIIIQPLNAVNICLQKMNKFNRANEPICNAVN